MVVSSLSAAAAVWVLVLWEERMGCGMGSEFANRLGLVHLFLLLFSSSHHHLPLPCILLLLLLLIVVLLALSLCQLSLTFFPTLVMTMIMSICLFSPSIVLSNLDHRACS